jgi:hypothetical protein
MNDEVLALFPPHNHLLTLVSDPEHRQSQVSLGFGSPRGTADPCEG